MENLMEMDFYTRRAHFAVSYHYRISYLEDGFLEFSVILPGTVKQLRDPLSSAEVRSVGGLIRFATYPSSL